MAIAVWHRRCSLPTPHAFHNVINKTVSSLAISYPQIRFRQCQNAVAKVSEEHFFLYERASALPE